MPLPSAQFSAEPTCCSVFSHTARRQRSSQFSSRSAARRPLLLASNVSFCLSTLSCFLQLHVNAFARRAGHQATETTPLLGVSFDRFSRLTGRSGLVFPASQPAVRCPRPPPARAARTTQRAAHTHSIIAILRFILFRSILIPSMMKKIPSSFGSILPRFISLCNRQSRDAALHTERTSAAIFPIWRKFLLILRFFPCMMKKNAVCVSPRPSNSFHGGKICKPFPRHRRDHLPFPDSGGDAFLPGHRAGL